MSPTEKKLVFREDEANSDAITDIGWLYVLRICASGIVPLSNHVLRSGIPFHLTPLVKESIESVNPQQLKSLIDSELEKYESEIFIKDNIVLNNLKRLANKFGFDDLEVEILFFRIMCRLHLGIDQTLDCIPDNRWFDSKLHKFLSIAFQKSEQSIESVLQEKGKLCSSGLIGVNRTIGGSFTDKLFVMDGFVSAMCKPAQNIDDLLSFVLTKSPKSDLTIEDFSHQSESVELIQQYLIHATKQAIKGVNILLYGSPGVGKTELARVISTSLNMNAYTVNHDQLSSGHDELSEAIPVRFRGYLLLQSLLSQSPKGLVIFDEIEDVLPRPGILDKPGFSNKAWFNQLLEENAVPSIWIANHVWQIDPAFMRRFDIVLEVKSPPRQVRGKLLKKAFNEVVMDEPWLEKKSGESDLTPALIKKSIGVLRHLKDQSPAHLQMQFDLQMKERRSAQGLSISSAYPETKDYQLKYLNVGTDMQSLVDNIAKNQKGKVLLYGPPGCGKTAFAHHLAKVSDKPLMLKRASDLISKWLGETESKLCEMFEEASRDDAILLLDEADSFLQDRRNAERSWELTQVNELLTQMENFNGVFICATNFMEHLDKAAMRRFSFKLKFDYLNLEQSKDLFNNTFRILGGGEPTTLTQQKINQRLVAMKNLTPGDFKAVADSFEILNKTPTYDEFIDSLARECEIKNYGQIAKIGFAA